MISTTPTTFSHSLPLSTTRVTFLPDHTLFKVARHVANALEMGAKLETGGGEVPEQGANFFTPTVLTGVTNDMAAFR